MNVILALQSLSLDLSVSSISGRCLALYLVSLTEILLDFVMLVVMAVFGLHFSLVAESRRWYKEKTGTYENLQWIPGHSDS